ncbi:hypothetical protein DMUE_0262 [Dictyocoela muelleri]|nr:hypothetical protein DMUE_0262 [Dictyocoela muelleri]
METTQKSVFDLIKIYENIAVKNGFVKLSSPESSYTSNKTTERRLVHRKEQSTPTHSKQCPVKSSNESIKINIKDKEINKPEIIHSGCILKEKSSINITNVILKFEESISKNNLTDNRETPDSSQMKNKDSIAKDTEMINNAEHDKPSDNQKIIPSDKTLSSDNNSKTSEHITQEELIPQEKDDFRIHEINTPQLTTSDQEIKNLPNKEEQIKSNSNLEEKIDDSQAIGDSSKNIIQPTENPMINEVVPENNHEEIGDSSKNIIQPTENTKINEVVPENNHEEIDDTSKDTIQPEEYPNITEVVPETRNEINDNDKNIKTYSKDGDNIVLENKTVTNLTIESESIPEIINSQSPEIINKDENGQVCHQKYSGDQNKNINKEEFQDTSGQYSVQTENATIKKEVCVINNQKIKEFNVILNNIMNVEEKVNVESFDGPNDSAVSNIVSDSNKNDSVNNESNKNDAVNNELENKQIKDQDKFEKSEELNSKSDKNFKIDDNFIQNDNASLHGESNSKNEVINEKVIENQDSLNRKDDLKEDKCESHGNDSISISEDKKDDVTFQEIKPRKVYIDDDSKPFEKISHKELLEQDFSEKSQSARKNILQYEKERGFFKKLYEFLTCRSCCGFETENTNSINPVIYKLVDYLNQNYSTSPHLFKTKDLREDYKKILEMIRKNEQIDFDEFTAVDIVSALKMYLREEIDGFLDVKMTRVIFESLIEMDKKGEEIIRQNGKMVIVRDRLLLLFKVLTLFIKISGNYFKTGCKYNELVEVIAPYFFPISGCQDVEKGEIIKVAQLICDKNNLEEIEKIFYYEN